MPLTLGEATRAGELAARIIAADSSIAGIDARLAENAEIASMVAILADGNSVRAEDRMTATESRVVFQFVRGLLEARRAALRAELDAL